MKFILQNFLQGPSHILVLKESLAPSSAKVTWGTASALLGIENLQKRWNPPKYPYRVSSLAKLSQSTSESLQMMIKLTEVTEEIGLYPPLTLLLCGIVDRYSGTKKYAIINQFNVFPSTSYRVDTAIVMGTVEVSTWL